MGKWQLLLSHLCASKLLRFYIHFVLREHAPTIVGGMLGLMSERKPNCRAWKLARKAVEPAMDQ